MQYKLTTQLLYYMVQAIKFASVDHSTCRDGSQVHRLKATWSGKLLISDSHTTAIYVYYKTERRNRRC